MAGVDDKASRLRGDEQGFDDRFSAVYDSLNRARLENSPKVYERAIGELAGTMRDEIMFYHGSGYGDLHHSMVRWAYDAQDLLANNQENRNKVVSGKAVEFLSSTLTNQKVPHPDESKIISESFARGVAGYVNGRGRGFIVAEVEGLGFPPEDRHTGREMSPWRTKTVVSGFKPEVSEVPQIKISEKPFDWEAHRIPDEDIK